MIKLQHLKVPLLFAWGFLLRLSFSLNGPIAEDDWARYFWEGNLILNGISPYNHPPEFFFLSENLDEKSTAILSQVNHPDWTTIYSPLLVLFFSLSQWLTPWKSLGLLLLYLLCDGLVFKTLLNLGGIRSALIYWIHPVLIKEIYANLHFELLPLAFLCLSLYLFYRSRFSGLFLGLALHLKILLIPILFPLLFLLKAESRKKTFRFIFLACFGFLIPFLVFSLFFPETSLHSFLKTFSFATSFEFNAMGFFLLRLFLGHTAARWVAIALMLCFLIFWFWLVQKKDVQKPEFIWLSGILFFLFLAFSPVCNAWYFLFLLPFAILGQSVFLHLSVWVPQALYLTKTRLGIPTEGFYDLPNFVPILILICLGLGFFLERDRWKLILSQSARF